MNDDKKQDAKFQIALDTLHPLSHKAADAFWDYWRENGETHKHGYYESTWGAINRALRLVGVKQHAWGGVMDTSGGIVEPVEAKAGEVVVTCDPSGRAVVVSRQDEQGQILSIIWEAEPEPERATPAAPEAASPAAESRTERALKVALQKIADMTFDPWTNGAEAGRVAATALALAAPVEPAAAVEPAGALKALLSEIIDNDCDDLQSVKAIARTLRGAAVEPVKSIWDMCDEKITLRAPPPGVAPGSDDGEQT